MILITKNTDINNNINSTDYNHDDGIKQVCLLQIQFNDCCIRFMPKMMMMMSISVTHITVHLEHFGVMYLCYLLIIDKQIPFVTNNINHGLLLLPIVVANTANTVNKYNYNDNFNIHGTDVHMVDNDCDSNPWKNDALM